MLVGGKICLEKETHVMPHLPYDDEPNSRQPKYLSFSFTFISITATARSKMASFILGTGGGVLAAAAVYYTMSAHLAQDTSALEAE